MIWFLLLATWRMYLCPAVTTVDTADVCTQPQGYTYKASITEATHSMNSSNHQQQAHLCLLQVGPLDIYSAAQHCSK